MVTVIGEADERVEDLDMETRIGGTEKPGRAEGDTRETRAGSPGKIGDAVVAHGVGTRDT